MRDDPITNTQDTPAEEAGVAMPMGKFTGNATNTPPKAADDEETE